MRVSAASLAGLAISNILLPLAVLIFASGFFPYKPVLPGLATFQDVEDDAVLFTAERPRAIFDRVVFMVVDALRSDFVYGHGSGFEFTQSLIRSGAAIPFTAHATPPTVTMPRVKALTTGSVPSFLDLILNFAESDTSSSLATQDTWLAQIRANGGKLVFYGDDTWLKLFPGDFFARSDGTSSFFVSDFTEVDLNVTRHLPRELAQDDWNALILHYLGMDHIGHKTGPEGPAMIPKQREMDGLVRQIYSAVETNEHHANTLLVLAGDHGMNAGGNHGGSGPGETEPALLFASPKFKAARRHSAYECPTNPRPGTDFHFYTKLEQSDVVPALTSLMGLPVPKNSLGVYIRELSGLWSSTEVLQLLHHNAHQMLVILRAKFGDSPFDAAEVARNDEAGQLAQEWTHAEQLLRLVIKDQSEAVTAHEDALYTFLHHAQDALSDTASLYDIPKMVTGIVIASIALIAISSSGFINRSSLFLVFVGVLYAVMMHASSYVEEEQHFWYWFTPAWILLLGARRFMENPNGRRKAQIVAAVTLSLAIHRLVYRWNQTGQKHAGEPDIVHYFFPSHHVFMWVLICTTYVYIGALLHLRTLSGIFAPELAAFANVSVVVTAIVFKLNFTQADAPEIVKDLASGIREYTAPFDLVFQARAVFIMITCILGSILLVSVYRWRFITEMEKPTKQGTQISLVERLHPLLLLFLMTQTRAPNTPLFLGLEIQRYAIRHLLDSDALEVTIQASKSQRSLATQVATTTLLLSHVYYFCMGGSNSISSIDLGNAYNGVADYNIVAVGVLLFASNWAGPIYWCSAATLLMLPKVSPPEPDISIKSNGAREWVALERAKLRQDAVNTNSQGSLHQASVDRSGLWTTYVAHMTFFIAASNVGVMVACTSLRTHLFIWTVFSPKYLYAAAWSVGWHLIVNVVLGSVLAKAANVL